MTNHEKIKQMSAVELAEFMTQWDCNHCSRGGSYSKYNCDSKCIKNIAEWLNTEAEPSKLDTCLKCSQWKSGTCRKPYDMPCKYEYEQLKKRVEE